MSYSNNDINCLRLRPTAKERWDGLTVFNQIITKDIDLVYKLAHKV